MGTDRSNSAWHALFQIQAGEDRLTRADAGATERTNQEDRAVDIHAELQALGFVRAGGIRPENGGQSCRAFIDPDVKGFVVYAHVVGNQVKKFGTTTPSLKARMQQNASTINGRIALLEGRAPRDAGWYHRSFDAFKRLAPEVIWANQEIEVWADAQGGRGGDAACHGRTGCSSA